VKDLIRQAIREFCVEFVREPYLCYTEHGLHALFYSQLLAAIPEDRRYADWHGHRVCVVQKEYPTAGTLGKPQRQHWDIAVLKAPLHSNHDVHGYDYLRLEAAIEFGLNATEEHLVDDIQRLSHRDASLDAAFAVHLYRLSSPGALISGRDWSPLSKQILSAQAVAALAPGHSVEVFYGMADLTGAHDSGAWRIAPGAAIERLA
jgi:hypothetical protein